MWQLFRPNLCEFLNPKSRLNRVFVQARIIDADDEGIAAVVQVHLRHNGRVRALALAEIDLDGPLFCREMDRKKERCKKEGKDDDR